MFPWLRKKTPKEKLQDSISSLNAVKNDLLLKQATYGKRIQYINLANTTNKVIKSNIVPSVIQASNQLSANNDTKKSVYNRLWWRKQWGKLVEWRNAPKAALQKKRATLMEKIFTINNRINDMETQLNTVNNIENLTQESSLTNKQKTQLHNSRHQLQFAQKIKGEATAPTKLTNYGNNSMLSYGDQSSNQMTGQSDGLLSSVTSCYANPEIANNTNESKVYKYDYTSFFSRRWSKCKKLVDKCEVAIENSNNVSNELTESFAH